MPFVGVLPERRWLFRPQPISNIAVSDAAAWRLNPAHRHVYDKLGIALGQGLLAAPCGVAPTDLGIAAGDRVFVKPITNLAGMSLGAGAMRADSVPATPGSFWCEYLGGTHVSSDCLVRDGELLMSVHTLASAEQDKQRPIWWQVGVDRPQHDAVIAAWIAAELPGYTGLCNMETIGERIIEAHLRGSNGFFDLYGEGFIPAWVALVDRGEWSGPVAIPGGTVASLFSSGDLSPRAPAIAKDYAVTIAADSYSSERMAIVRGRDKGRVLAALQALAAASGAD